MTVTVAPGTTAPVESLTVPVIWPVAVWALTVPAVLSIASTAPKMASFFIGEVSSSNKPCGPTAISPTGTTSTLERNKRSNPSNKAKDWSGVSAPQSPGRKLLRVPGLGFP